MLAQSGKTQVRAAGIFPDVYWATSTNQYDLKENKAGFK
jgi:hypothetical protein